MAKKNNFRRDSDNFERREPRRFIREDRPERRSSERFERRGSARSGFNKQMHEVTCDKCGNQCEVPFRPTAGKPVYCSDCFRKQEGNESRGNKAPTESVNLKAEINLLNRKLDRIISLLEDQ
jgi:CxxC-x17-CxxC domain-containing protein